MAAHICHRGAWVSSLIFVVEFNTLHMFQHLFRVSDAILVGGGAAKMTKLQGMYGESRESDV